MIGTPFDFGDTTIVAGGLGRNLILRKVTRKPSPAKNIILRIGTRRGGGGGGFTNPRSRFWQHFGWCQFAERVYGTLPIYVCAHLYVCIYIYGGEIPSNPLRNRPPFRSSAVPGCVPAFKNGCPAF